MFENYKEILKSKVSKNRYQHCLNVSEKAVYLAKKYGADVEKAKVAGLLHDVTKDLTRKEQLKIISDYGAILTKSEKENQKLWHAITGAYFIKNKLMIKDNDIFDAVRYHTTGRAGMSLLEKIIFMADMISKERIFIGIDRLRKVADENIDHAMCVGTLFSICSLIVKKSTIDNNTFAAYNDSIKNFSDGLYEKKYNWSKFAIGSN